MGKLSSYVAYFSKMVYKGQNFNMLLCTENAQYKMFLSFSNDIALLCIFYMYKLYICYSCLILHKHFTDLSCQDAFQINSTCYKIHKERVRWFTAVNRCLSYNASLAVFDDDVRRYFSSSLLSNSSWIGLVKSWWTWPG